MQELPFWMPGCSADPGPRVVRTFHVLFALVSLSAWLSLGAQLPVLIGSHGLSPASDFFREARAGGFGVLELPSWLWLAHGDGTLMFGVVLGVLCSLAALFGFGVRIALVCNAVLYLGYAIACDAFTAFQWDNMLVEVSLLAALLPRERPAPYAVLLLRLMWFKLYLESGIAKWQSELGDWRDGSAMSFYYETAPLPTWLAWYAHHLPAWFHRFESRAALFMELVVPFFAFGPRALRLFAFAYVSAFLIIDTATANYGFFTYLAAALQVFLLRDEDLERIATFVRKRLPAWLSEAADPPSTTPLPAAGLAARALFGIYFAAWLVASIGGAAMHFAPRARESEPLSRAYATWEPLRFANVYHLFGSITRERIEPEFQTLRGTTWTAQPLRYKPGPLERPPPFVAPHQPRVDFRLWFYGLSFQRGMPRFVHTLLDRLCHDARAVQPLFASALPQGPDAVRIAFARYHFTAPEERARTGAYWTRAELGALAPHECR